MRLWGLPSEARLWRKLAPAEKPPEEATVEGIDAALGLSREG
ncbi:hypothetical protein [Labedaea rhizosphaerae]|uniref:Uncharacterized protein n=1 Tax=Labedaea rhizosphaerae TaxID=598644 RepID=A0A4R6RUE4_LABRH|nr:hypothetical protein [Labedaea rhizosphaerae]TDP90520.1 hypothetical protein EV186_11060 [Labedaea rhizosphaerae]